MAPSMKSRWLKLFLPEVAATVSRKGEEAVRDTAFDRPGTEIIMILPQVWHLVEWPIIDGSTLYCCPQ
jgi:hypothetical protein